MKVLRKMMIAGLIMEMMLINAPLAEATEPAKVAILDSGSNLTYTEGISLIDGTVKDQNGHGTLMAGIIKEVYPDAEFYIVKVMGKDGLAVNEEAVILGLEWAISKEVDVINMSLRLKESTGLRKAVEKAYNKGIVIVAAQELSHKTA